MANLIQNAARGAIAYALFGGRGEHRSSLENPQTPLSFPAEWLLDIFNGGRTDSGIRVSELTALQVSTVMACVNVISRGVGMLPLNVFERAQVAKRQAKYKAHDHYLYPTLRREPNCEMTASTFFRTFMCHCLLWGNGYAEITYDKGGRVHSIWPRNPHMTTPQRLLQKERIDGDWHPAGTLVYRTSEAFNQAINEDGSIKQSGFERIILAENMIHVPGLSIDGRIGQSTIWMARQIIGLALAAEKYSAKFFGNGAVPRGILEIANDMEEKAIEELRRQWHEAHGGENAHKVAVLTAGMKFTPIAFNAEQSQLLETRKFQRGEIAALFNVPGHMVGDTNEKGKSNVEQSSIEFLTYTLMPWLVAIEQEFERKLFPDKGQTANKFFPKFDTHLLKYPDADTRGKLFNGGKQWGWLNTNDIHEFEDMNPVPGPSGEKYWMPINMQDADDPQHEFDQTHPTPEPKLPDGTPPAGGGKLPTVPVGKVPVTPAKVEKKSSDAEVEKRIYKSVDEVPDNVPKAHRKQWLEIWNSVYKKAIADGKSHDDAEESAFTQANGVIKKQTEKKSIDALSRSFVPLIRDGIGRIAHRKTVSLADIHRVFRPVLSTIIDTLDADVEDVIGVEGEVLVVNKRSAATEHQRIENYCRALYARSGTWSAEAKTVQAETEARIAVETFFVEARYAEEQPRDDRGRWVPTGEQVAELLGRTGDTNHGTTKQAFTDSKGNYTEDRQALHDASVEKIVDPENHTAPTGRAPVVESLGGGTASGKGTIVKELAANDPNLVHLDADKAQQHIPELSGLKEIDPQHAAERCYLEGKDIQKQCIQECMKDGLDFINDTTGGGAGAISNIENFAKAGYTVNALYTDIPVNLAIERAADRANTSLIVSDKGRVVPTQVILDTHYGAARNFMLVKDMPQVNEKRLYDNTERGKPELIYQRTGMGEEHVHNQVKWDAYREKATKFTGYV